MALLAGQSTLAISAWALTASCAIAAMIRFNASVSSGRMCARAPAYGMS